MVNDHGFALLDNLHLLREVPPVITDEVNVDFDPESKEALERQKLLGELSNATDDAAILARLLDALKRVPRSLSKLSRKVFKSNERKVSF